MSDTRYMFRSIFSHNHANIIAVLCLLAFAFVPVTQSIGVHEHSETSLIPDTTTPEHQTPSQTLSALLEVGSHLSTQDLGTEAGVDMGSLKDTLAALQKYQHLAELKEKVEKREHHDSVAAIETTSHAGAHATSHLEARSHLRARTRQVGGAVNTQVSGSASTTDPLAAQPEKAKATFAFEFNSDAVTAQGLNNQGATPACCWARWAGSDEPHQGVEDFDGDQSYLVLSTPSIGGRPGVVGGSGGMTFEVVVRFRKLTTDKLIQALFDMGSGVACQDNIVMHQVGATGSLEFRVYRNTELKSTDPATRCSDSNVVVMTADNVFEDLDWVYLVVTIDSTGIWRLYVNGVQPKGFTPFKGVIPLSLSRPKIYLGKSSWLTPRTPVSQNEHFNGEMDSFRYWAQTLQDADVLALYNEQQPVNCELDEWPTSDATQDQKCFFYASTSDFTPVPPDANATTCLTSFWRSDVPKPPDSGLPAPEPLAEFQQTHAYRVVQRGVLQNALRGGIACPTIDNLRIKVDCNLLPCPLACLPGDWSQWSSCSVSCGTDGIDVVGQQTRNRYILKKPEWDNGQPLPCPSDTDNRVCQIPCSTPCEVSDFGPWTQCSLDCGRGTQSHTRVVTKQPTHSGQICPSLQESQDCNTDPCVRTCMMSDWQPSTFGPGDCDSPCGNGTLVQTRTVIQAAVGSTPCPTDLSRRIPCNTDPCTTHCQVSAWSLWGDCDKDCGDGVIVRTRMVTTPSAFGGLGCPPLSQAIPCPGIQPCDYLSKLRNLKDRIRRLELQKRVEYLEHLHLLAKARQLLFPPTTPTAAVSSTGDGCPNGGCGVKSSSAAFVPSSSAVYVPPEIITKYVKQPVVYIIDRPFPVEVSTAAPPPPAFSSSAQPPPAPSPDESSSGPCTDCVEATVIQPCCPGECCQPKPDLVEAIAVDHLDDCCDHSSPHFGCCPNPGDCCHWPSPDPTCCSTTYNTQPNIPPPHHETPPPPEQEDVPQSCCHLEDPPQWCCSGRPKLHDERRVFADAEGSSDPSNYDTVQATEFTRKDADSCCMAYQPEAHCCSSFRQKIQQSQQQPLTDQEQLQAVDNTFLEVQSRLPKHH